ncbi:four helix bundle protein [Mucilaginibacter sp. OK268]|uniref:four helix bundle protein n=1 Tax=Mucilaginibacter sp. OK268 TaxID=1881048 RepID=UPI001C4094ED|nr:four helix bundle protein [Mucilaginibacter sp. OK268]
MELSKDVYLLTQKLSTEHRFGISSQLYRAAVSIPSNIAEGSSRKSEKDFSHFLSMSLGSAFELETQLIIAEQCGLAINVDYQSLLAKVQALQKQIASFAYTISQ